MFTYRVEPLPDHDRVGYVILDDGGAEVGTVFDKDNAIELVRLMNNGGTAEDVVNFGIETAKRYALAMHGDQDHGCLKISQHLEIVAELVDAHCGYAPDSIQRLIVVSAAWLHDVLEDTAVTVDELLEDVAEETVSIVEAVTDGWGRNRYERHLNTYWRIREHGPDAVLVKLCDRLHNHARSLKHKERYLEMYLGEYPYFKMALWRPGEHDKLWELLDNQHEAMKDAAQLQKGKRVAEHSGTGGSPDGEEPGSGKGHS